MKAPRPSACTGAVDWPFLLKMCPLLAMIGGALLLDAKLTAKPPAPVPYWYEGRFPEEVHRGLNAWNPAGFECRRVAERGGALLVILDSAHGEHLKPGLAGSYRQRTIRIRENLPVHLVERVAAHEFGHFLGLGHTEEPGSIMTAKIHPAVHGPATADLQAAKERARSVKMKSLFFAAGLLQSAG
jgi:hypothetical protein